MLDPNDGDGQWQALFNQNSYIYDSTNTIIGTNEDVAMYFYRLNS